jgi:hypothetical protein
LFQLLCASPLPRTKEPKDQKRNSTFLDSSAFASLPFSIAPHDMGFYSGDLSMDGGILKRELKLRKRDVSAFPFNFYPNITGLLSVLEPVFYLVQHACLDKGWAGHQKNHGYLS